MELFNSLTGPVITFVGLVGIVVSFAMMFLSPGRLKDFAFPIYGGHVRRFSLEFAGAILALVAISVLGLVMLMWLGDIQGDGELNSTYVLIRGIADWMVKVSIGAIVGFSIARAAYRNGRWGRSVEGN